LGKQRVSQCLWLNKLEDGGSADGAVSSRQRCYIEDFRHRGGYDRYGWYLEDSSATRGSGRTEVVADREEDDRRSEHRTCGVRRREGCMLRHSRSNLPTMVDICFTFLFKLQSKIRS
jgi:hypothetical protein